MKNKKDRLNFRLINLVLVALLILILVSTANFWIWWGTKIFGILLPFLLAFCFAYIFYPVLKYMEKNGIPKVLGIVIIIILVVAFLGLVIYLLVPLVYDQTVNLISSSIKFIQDISTKYNIDLNYIQQSFSDVNKIVLDVGKAVSNSAFNIIKVFISVFSNLLIAFIVGIYFLSDMDNIRFRIKEFFKNKSKKTYNYVKSLDIEMKNYCSGLMKYILVQLIEYTLVFYLIGHPYFLILGILASFTTIIPYFGGIITNIIALITAILVSPKLFILTLIVSLILPNIDGYFWSPKIYGKSNNIHPIITIFSVFAGGALFGMLGIIVALPVAILLSQTYKYYIKYPKKQKV